MTVNDHLRFVRVPYKNELLSSWISRVISFYGVEWAEVREERGYPDIPDFGLTDEVRDFLVSYTAVNPEILAQMDLAEKFKGAPITRFVCHPHSRKAFPDFCLACFKDDASAGRDCFLRHEWAIAGVGCCHIHARPLESLCPFCEAEIVPRLAIKGDRSSAYCPVCEEELCKAEIEPRARAYPACMAYGLECENRVLENNRSEASKVTWKVIEDIAFLLFYDRLMRSRLLIKKAQSGWGDADYPVNAFTRLELQKFYDRSFFFPLASLRAVHRSRYLMASLAVIDGVGIGDEVLAGVAVGLEEFYRSLRDAGKDEMIFRSVTWPTCLQGELLLFLFCDEAWHETVPYMRKCIWEAQRGNRMTGKKVKYSSVAAYHRAKLQELLLEHEPINSRGLGSAV